MCKLVQFVRMLQAIVCEGSPGLSARGAPADKSGLRSDAPPHLPALAVVAPAEAPASGLAVRGTDGRQLRGRLAGKSSRQLLFSSRQAADFGLMWTVKCFAVQFEYIRRKKYFQNPNISFRSSGLARIAWNLLRFLSSLWARRPIRSTADCIFGSD